MDDETAKLGSYSLAGDVIVEILLRLPVKSLLRFGSVSKSWYYLLNSRDFIHTHRQIPNHEKLLRVSDRGPRDIPTISFFSIDTEEKVSEIVDFDETDSDLLWLSLSASVVNVVLPFACSHDDEVRIVGSINGLLCVHFNRSSSIILWNPGTRKYRFVELPDCVSFYSDPFFPYLMFGFVPEIDDYKVVKVSSSRRNDSNCKVWVYTLSSGSWEEIGSDVVDGLIPKGGSAVSLNGCLYWMSCSNDNEMDVITCFDLYKQVFGRIKLPNPDIVSSVTIRKLVVLKGCLSMIIDYSGNGRDWNDYEVWVMNKQQGVAESWNKIFDFSSLSKLARPVGSWRDCELLFGYPNGLSLELLSYNPFTRRARSFQRRSSVGGFKVINYVESLESVERS